MTRRFRPRKQFTVPLSDGAVPNNRGADLDHTS